MRYRTSVPEEEKPLIKRLFAGAATLIAVFSCRSTALAQVDGLDLRLSALVTDQSDYGVAIMPFGILFLFLIIYAAIISGLYIRLREKWNQQIKEFTRNTRHAQAQAERANLFLAADRQVLIVWNATNGAPELEGDPGLLVESKSPSRILTFSEWLPDEAAKRIDRSTHQLRSEGKSFCETLKTIRGEIVEIEGRPVIGNAVLAIRVATGERLNAARLADEKAALEEAHSQLKSVLEAIPQPMWLRDEAGNLGWVNRAYAQAVDVQDPQLVLASQAEFLDSEDRAVIRQMQATSGRYHGAVTAIVSGQRRKVDVVEISGPKGGGGFALDISELEATRHALEQQMEAHIRTLEELPTAVAIFDRHQKLTYYNCAFRLLFGFEAEFLDSKPSNSTLFDQLRSQRRVPEAQEYREWKNEILALYSSTETCIQGWRLPDRRALRVIITPIPEGGLKYHFDDETERFSIATLYDQLKTTQWETLMALSEGVGVFGSNGCLQLSNPAFAKLWAIEPAALENSPHIHSLNKKCRVCLNETWNQIATIVCALDVSRADHTFQATTSDSRVLKVATTPLPEGATLVTVTDVTDTVEAERRLREHNDALRRAAQLRTNFIKSVSFELRTPLSNIVGRAEALSEGVAGPLNQAQSSYALDLVRASGSMLALTQDILEIVDAENGAIDLSPEKISLEELVEDVTARLRERMSETGVRLSLNFLSDNKEINTDRKRLRQILFNLLADAISSSQVGEVVSLTINREKHQIHVQIIDSGRGMLVGLGSKVAGQLRADTNEVRSAGVRFSLAKALVVLMNGEIWIDNSPEIGYGVYFILPDA